VAFEAVSSIAIILVTVRLHDRRSVYRLNLLFQKTIVQLLSVESAPTVNEFSHAYTVVYYRHLLTIFYTVSGKKRPP